MPAPPRGARFLLLVLLASLLLPQAALASQGTIFVYHRFGESRYPSTNISIDHFAAQLDYLSRQKIPVLPLLDVVERLKSGSRLPERFVVLTVDDGYTSFLSGAMPLLRTYQMPVTLFVSSRSVGAHGYLDWDQLRSLKREGVSIGNHSHGHPYLVNLVQEQGLDAVRDELIRAQERFQLHLGAAPQLFAYPFGETLPQISRLVAELGFEAATVQHSGVVHAQSDLFELPRFAMGGVYATLEGFVEKSRTQTLPLRVVAPADGLLAGPNPPRLRMAILPGSSLKVGDLNCYVAGRPDCEIRSTEDERGFEVVARSPLTGRRNRYTLTAQGRDGSWGWFSWLWIDPRQGEP